MDCYQLLKNLPWIAIELDLEARILSCNDLAANWLGASAAELVHQNLIDFCKHKNYLPPFISNAHPSSPENMVFQSETYWINPEGDLCFLRWKMQWVKNNEEIKGIFLLAEDVTDSVRLRQQHQQLSHRLQGMNQELSKAKAASEQETEARSMFLANMSHDLKTPLHAVLGMAEILKVKKHSPEQDEQIDGILVGGQRILKVVEDVLSSMRGEPGKRLSQTESFDLRKLIEEVVNTVSASAHQKNLQLIISYCESVPHFVQSDPAAIRKIVMHLLTNAIKFTQNGYVMITVETLKLSGKTADLQITVEDTGIGISKNNLEKIFERFYRIDPTYKGQYAGTGVGLTIAKQLAEDLGGVLKVNSREGSGSTFWCTLPFSLSQEAAPAIESFTARVLIVDDLLIRGQTIRKQLLGEGHQVVRGVDALSTLKQAHSDHKSYDLVLIDDQIYGVTMLDLIRAVQNERALETPVFVAMTQPNTASTPERLKEAGFSLQFVKPIQPSRLAQELLEAMRSRKKMPSIPAASSRNLKHQVLLVEDNVFSQRVTKVMLEALDCELSLAMSGAAADKLLNEKRFEIIFLDLDLPDVDGMDIAKKIRSQSSVNQQAYVCALTAHVDSGTRARSLAAGMNDFLPKPAQLDEFRRVISKAQDWMLKNITASFA